MRSYCDCVRVMGNSHGNRKNVLKVKGDDDSYGDSGCNVYGIWVKNGEW